MERSTKSKALVAGILQSYGRPVSLTDLARMVRMTRPHTAYSTVFRIVRHLETDGRVRRVDWRERGSRYEWGEQGHHHHIVCRLCGCVAELSDDDLGFDTERIAQHTGFSVSHHSIELEGICAACREGS